MPSRRERVVTRKYSLLAASGVVPLAIVIVVLAVFQFSAQREQLRQELQEEVVQHGILLAGVAKTVQDYVRTLAAWGEIHARDPAPPAGPRLAAALAARQIDQGGLLVAGSGLASRPGADGDRRLAGDLARHMRLGHETMPYLRWSYFVTAAPDLLLLVPFFEGQTLGGELRQASEDRLIEALAGGDGLADGFPPATPRWTAARPDPAGAGWITAYVAPVRNDGASRGMVGAAVLLDFLTGFLRAFDYPAGQLWLTNEQGQVLAAVDGRTMAGVRLLSLEDVLPGDLAGVDPRELLAASGSFSAFGDHYALSQGVGSTPWTLLFIASSAEIDRVILPRMVPYGIILACLIVTLALAHLMRQRLIVRPALAFADFIEAEAQEAHPVGPDLPAFWQPLVAAAAEAFAAKRNSLARIEDSEALKSAIIDSSLDALIAIDTEDRVVEFNPAAVHMFGIERAAALGRNLAHMVVPEHLRPAHAAGIRRYVQSGEARIIGRRVEYEAVRADGTRFPVEIAIADVHQENRRLFTAYVRDITHRRQMEQALRASEQHFRSIADAHPVALNITRLGDGIILHASQAFANLFGLPVEQVVGHTTMRFYTDPADRARLIEALERDGAVAGFEVGAVRADGTRFPAALNSRIIEFQGAKAIISGVVDLSQQKAAEAEIARQREALAESERRVRTIAEAHPVPMYIARRADRRIVYANQRFADLMRLSLDEVCRRVSTQFYPDAGERERVAQALRRDRAVQDFETTARRGDGSSFPVAVTAQLIDYQGEEAAVFGLVDLTEVRATQAEMARQRDALHQSEKLNALGSLLANVAHELNNPLSVVVGYATMMRDLAPDAATRERALKVQAAAERCARIVRTFLAMARRKPEAHGRVEIDKLIQGALEVAGYGLRTADVEVTLDLLPDAPPVFGDGDQLTLVLMNLIVNAQHALQTRPLPRRLEIATRRVDGALEIEIADNGPGIPAEIVERVFEPFFTTKPQGMGTGIGLSVCHGIVAAHGGEITLASGLHGGALFTLTLPLSATAAPKLAAATAEPELIEGRILLVEDEDEVAQMLAEVLARDRHEVLLARSGREALERLAAEDVDLIISDIRMPDLDGPALYHQLADQAPETARRMVFVTGDVLTPETTGFLAETALPVLEKPIDPHDLRIKVQGFLARASAPEGLVGRRPTAGVG